MQCLWCPKPAIYCGFCHADYQRIWRACPAGFYPSMYYAIFCVAEGIPCSTRYLSRVQETHHIDTAPNLTHKGIDALVMIERHRPALWRITSCE